MTPLNASFCQLVPLVPVRWRKPLLGSRSSTCVVVPASPTAGTPTMAKPVFVQLGGMWNSVPVSPFVYTSAALAAPKARRSPWSSLTMVSTTAVGEIWCGALPFTTSVSSISNRYQPRSELLVKKVCNLASYARTAWFQVSPVAAPRVGRGCPFGAEV
jgi:hypothetical protein